MTWPTFIATSLVIGMAVVSLFLLLVAPEKMVIDRWLQQTRFGSPSLMFLVAFIVGGGWGYMQPTHPLAAALPLTETLSTATGWFCTFKIFELVLWDIVAVHYGGVDASVSRWIQNTSFDAPLATAGAGFLCGHFFMYRNWAAS